MPYHEPLQHLLHVYRLFFQPPLLVCSEVAFERHVVEVHEAVIHRGCCSKNHLRITISQYKLTEGRVPYRRRLSEKMGLVNNYEISIPVPFKCIIRVLRELFACDSIDLNMSRAHLIFPRGFKNALWSDKKWSSPLSDCIMYKAQHHPCLSEACRICYQHSIVFFKYV